MVLLTTAMMPLSVLASWNYITQKERGFYALMLVLLTGLVGVFIALDLFLFYVFFEVMLIPMYFIIGIWGGTNRLYAAIKFFIYTMAGSLLMLVAIVVMVWTIGGGTGTLSFAYEHLLANAGPLGAGGALALRRLRAGVRHQGADLPAPHLAARRPRGGAHGGQRPPGRGDAQDRHLRLPPLCGAVLSPVALCPAVTRLIVVLAVIGIIYGALVAHGPARHQEAGGLLLGEPPGLRDAGDLGRHRAAASRARSW